MGAAADCEVIAGGLLGQPANTLTTLAFVLAGVAVIVGRPRAGWVGAGLVATGLGSFLFHGPMPPGSEWAHDVSLAWLLTLVAGIATHWEGHSRIPALIVLGVVFAVVPPVADPTAAVLAVVVVVSLLRRDWRAAWGPLLLLGTVAVLGRLGATGGPLCHPDSWLQPHGLWHLGSAGAVLWWVWRSPITSGPARHPGSGPWPRNMSPT